MIESGLALPARIPIEEEITDEEIGEMFNEAGSAFSRLTEMEETLLHMTSTLFIAELHKKRS